MLECLDLFFPQIPPVTRHTALTCLLPAGLPHSVAGPPSTCAGYKRNVHVAPCLRRVSSRKHGLLTTQPRFPRSCQRSAEKVTLLTLHGDTAYTSAPRPLWELAAQTPQSQRPAPGARVPRPPLQPRAWHAGPVAGSAPPEPARCRRGNVLVSMPAAGPAAHRGPLSSSPPDGEEGRDASGSDGAVCASSSLPSRRLPLPCQKHR